MNHKAQENTAATVLRVIFAIIATFVFLVLTNSLLLKASIFRSNYWTDLLTSDETMELLKEEISHDFNDEFDFEGFDPGMSDQMSDEFFELVIQDIVDGMVTGDTTIDKDEYMDFLDEYEDIIFADLNIPSSEIDNAKEEYIDEFSDAFDRMFSDMEDEDGLEVFEQIKDAGKINDKIIIVCTFALVLMLIILLVIHRNKFRPIRAMGIAMIVAESINVLIWGLILLIVYYFNEMAQEEDAIIQVFVNYFSKGTYILAFTVLLSLIAAIVITVIGSTGASRIDEQLMEE